MSERALPDAIARHLDRALPEGAPEPKRVRLSQTGEMVQKPGGRRLEFTAVQQYATRPRRVRVAGLLRNEPVRPRQGHGSLSRWGGAADRPHLGSRPRHQEHRAGDRPGRGHALPRRAAVGPVRADSEPRAVLARARRRRGGGLHPGRRSRGKRAAGIRRVGPDQARIRNEAPSSRRGLRRHAVGRRVRRLHRARRDPASGQRGGELGPSGGALHLLARRGRLTASWTRPRASAAGTARRAGSATGSR